MHMNRHKEGQAMNGNTGLHIFVLRGTGLKRLRARSAKCNANRTVIAVGTPANEEQCKIAAAWVWCGKQDLHHQRRAGRGAWWSLQILAALFEFEHLNLNVGHGHFDLHTGFDAD
mmetsp:Transcript_24355/g.41913  ORF Transcript_24355/g.41913 Transcript_24355/m.41913 type:complete len:115 (-) Transcript_24355:306-650(-)